MSLSISRIPTHLSRDNLHLAYELILFLKLYPKFNDVYIPSGYGLGELEGFMKHLMKGTALYVYNEDRSKLIYSFYSIRQAASLLPCSYTALRDSLVEKRPVFGIRFEKELIKTVRSEFVSL